MPTVKYRLSSTPKFWLLWNLHSQILDLFQNPTSSKPDLSMKYFTRWLVGVVEFVVCQQHNIGRYPVCLTETNTASLLTLQCGSCLKTFSRTDALKRHHTSNRCRAHPCPKQQLTWHRESCEFDLKSLSTGDNCINLKRHGDAWFVRGVIEVIFVQMLYNATCGHVRTITQTRISSLLVV